MDAVDKLLRKLQPKDRSRLNAVLKQIRSGNFAGIKISRVKGKKIFKTRVGRFRIIFSYDSKFGEIGLKKVTLRNEKTYKRLR